jgi:tetratricopeptide (TPR) repeat protein
MKRYFFALAALLLMVGPVHADFAAGLAAYRRGEYAKALKEFKALAEKGLAGAQYNLGLMYYKGQGVTQDYAEALKWYRKAADKGDAGAKYILGFMYHQGQGVARDYTEAMNWYEKAADHGHASALFNLGLMYYKGHGVVPNYIQAHLWITLATVRSAGKTQERYSKARDLVAKKMTREQIAEAQRLATEWKPKKLKAKN